MSNVSNYPKFTAHPSKDKIILAAGDEKVLYYANDWKYSFGIYGKIIEIYTRPLKPKYYWKCYYYTADGLKTGRNPIYPDYGHGLLEMIERERLEEKKNGYGKFEGKELEKFIRDRKYILTITENINGENVKSLEMKFNKNYEIIELFIRKIDFRDKVIKGSLTLKFNKGIIVSEEREE
jgi:hypothetical protein